jgi:hypothetical protein
MIGGYTPTAIRQLSGTVLGSARIDLMGRSHDQERHSIAVAGATVSVKARTDTAFFKKGEIKYHRGMKHSAGKLKEWKCGSELAAAKTDQGGNFTTIPLEPGKYCLDIIGPQLDNESECGSHSVLSGKNVCVPLHASFIIDVVPSAPKAALIADISQMWPDCSGGAYLTLKPVK